MRGMRRRGSQGLCCCELLGGYLDERYFICQETVDLLFYTRFRSDVHFQSGSEYSLTGLPSIVPKASKGCPFYALPVFDTRDHTQLSRHELASS
jgi:hypothetical protein